MQFITISLTVMGLLALTSAAPSLEINKRALSPRKHTVDIIDTTFEQLTEIEQGSEIQLTSIVEKKITQESQKETAKDNIRKNHYASKNSNANTVITVVTEVIDARSNEQVTRIMTHQVSVKNSGATSNIQVTVAEIKQIIITAADVNGLNGGGNNAGTSSVSTNSTSTGSTSNNSTSIASGSANSNSTAQPPQQITPTSPLLGSNSTLMLPPGATAPTNGQIEFDPAAILEADQTTFFVEQVTAS